MELWIRSQNKQWLMPANDIISVFQKNVFCKGIILGEYKTEERALEVLDEIQSKVKQQYIVRPSGLTSKEEKDEEAARLKYYYNGDFIMENEMFKIEPINSGIVIYEMPEE